MRFDRLIRDSRKRAGLSQAALAARAKTSQPAIARYEAGVATPSLATLDRVLRACNDSIVVGARKRGTPVATDRRSKLALLRGSRDRLVESARRHGIRDIKVFGSVARGADDPASDIDLLVDLDPERTLLDLIGFKQDAEDILGVRVDAAAPRFMKDRVRKQALQDARAL